MFKILHKPALALFLSVALVACSEDDDKIIDEPKPALRAEISYTALDNQKPYAEQFKNAAGVSTVDLSEGNNRHRMFQALNYYSSSNTAANTAIDAAQLRKLYANTGDPFVDISTATISVNGATLNASGVNLKNVTASSWPTAQADEVRDELDDQFDAIAAASASVTETAENGKAGKLGTYLVDERGIEIIQIIQKSLIGSLQLDYIGNVLLTTGLEAENHEVVSGKLYSQLEHNWDEAYALFTLNPVYLYNTTTSEASSDTERKTVEFGAGAYVWEYNKSGYPKIFAAFLKGRAAIVNNDKTELQTQATLIRTELEKAIANAALGYLAKWKAGGATVAAQAHAIGEGIGFIYSLRFAKIHGGTAAWSDDVIDDLVGSENGFWDLDVDKINAAEDAIKAKFNL